MKTAWIIEEIGCLHIDETAVLKIAMTEEVAKQYAKMVANEHCREILQEALELFEDEGEDFTPPKVVDGATGYEFQVIDENDDVAWLVMWREIEVI